MAVSNSYRILFVQSCCAAIAMMVDAAPVTFESISTAADRLNTSVTVYNGSTALIKETRRVTLAPGLNRLVLRDVAAQMQVETVALRAVSGDALQLIEQNFDFDVLSPGRLLEKQIGGEVRVIKQDRRSGVDREERARLLATTASMQPEAASGRKKVVDGEMVLQFPDRIETGPQDRVAVDALPDGLKERPTLSVLLEAPRGGPQTVELTYLTDEVDWRANYVATLAYDGKRLDLQGWVSMTNESGSDFRDARLQLVAGKIHRVPRSRLGQSMTVEKIVVTGSNITRESFEPVRERLQDLYLYSFAHSSTIADHQTKQLSLLTAKAIPVRWEYSVNLNFDSACLWHGARNSDDCEMNAEPATRYLVFDNKEPLNNPLPEGHLVVHMKDRRGVSQYVDEASVSNTAKGETLRIKLRQETDIVASLRQVSFTELGPERKDSTWRAEVHNNKSEPVTVRLYMQKWRNAEVLSASVPHGMLGTIPMWQVELPAHASRVFDFTLRSKS
ncbi:DUF4139 domain-containing protein [Chitinimonas sp.]|uniref:DUF4139 domain-containing protein n=1 Tax=Chitinimonas sp. TaxID=1934313 RepID=UPI0035B24FAE